MILKWYHSYSALFRYAIKQTVDKKLSTIASVNKSPNELELLGQKYVVDNWTNITPQIISKLGRNLHITQYHPLSHVRQRVVNYFYNSYRNRTGTPLFSVHDNLNPIVTVSQNFDSLLVPKDHLSRKKTDCYYINQDTLLRAHTTAHQAELISMGLNNFLIVGDVYRRDEIDSTHYPVFHQIDAVRICTKEEIFKNVHGSGDLKLFDSREEETAEKQRYHTLESVKIMEHQLKSTLTGLAKAIFGQDVKYRWVDQYFPFTHPSWELEVFHENKWVELLGCGIIRQSILDKSGAMDRMGWAFGMGLERLAMCLYNIPDIRLFWSTDTGFLNQFKVDDVNTQIQYKAISIYPQCKNDISFWLPEDKEYTSNNFYELVREIGGDIIEQVILTDVFTHPKTKRISHCYTIVYRHMERTLSKSEVNIVHRKLEKAVTDRFHVTVR
ncbi:PREDICTED: probable phenylalanine--tRNA ligase, mitochondrial [Polistes canadensis]|uniref:probable phenylalanine--tRNA ligase, mitochondrial n=1 Tax=Polistes canadensis TaxID=91411 RepID=UPI00071902D7|nr:PREDICTED: probable phenylalanine--tRNA ligase, mitochondrial [Polistes canadensis]